MNSDSARGLLSAAFVQADASDTPPAVTTWVTAPTPLWAPALQAKAVLGNRKEFNWMNSPVGKPAFVQPAESAPGPPLPFHHCADWTLVHMSRWSLIWPWI